MEPYYEVSSWRSAVKHTIAIVTASLVVAGTGVILALLTRNPSALLLMAIGSCLLSDKRYDSSSYTGSYGGIPQASERHLA
ncbi:hypothetical protein [Homoserinimonas hongtaonis]|uniref:hypothetical protein n=1 Tax=Homoserinimonas hongtaonis TaxID=2079791 RepID=UPI00131F367F|nr:hypothetical protein [Salinibacterium hongtaonis]